MPFLYALGGMLLTFAGSLVGRVLLALGLTYVTYSGIDFGINYLEATIQQNISAMPSTVASFLGWLWVDKAISLVFSTYTVCVTIKLAGGTVLKKLVLK